MEELVSCFFPNEPSSSFLEVDETFLNFVQEAVKAEGHSSEDEIVELVTTLFPDHVVERRGLGERLIEYRRDLCGANELEASARCMAHLVLDDDLQPPTLVEGMLEDGRDDYTDSNSGATSSVPDNNEFLAVDESSLELLRGLCGVSDKSMDDVFIYVMTKIILGDVDDTARWLLDNGLDKAKELKRSDEKRQKERKKSELEAERLARERIMQKFDERPETEVDGLYKERKVRKAIAPESKVRYLDGKVVATNGAKFIEVGSNERWDGGSRGKVKTKGKRGPGWVAA